MAMTADEWDNERRKNNGGGKHGQGSKDGNKAEHPGDKHDNQGHPKRDQRDDRYDG